jgi:hypothetical protein
MMDAICTLETTWYYTDHHRRRCHCHLHVFSRGAGPVAVVATERADNPGMSITNAAELLWPDLIRSLPARHADTRGLENAALIEHYTHEDVREESTDQGDFDRVLVARVGDSWRVTWRPLRTHEQWRAAGLLDVARVMGINFIGGLAGAGGRHG